MIIRPIERLSSPPLPPTHKNRPGNRAQKYLPDNAVLSEKLIISDLPVSGGLLDLRNPSRQSSSDLVSLD